MRHLYLFSVFFQIGADLESEWPFHPAAILCFFFHVFSSFFPCLAIDQDKPISSNAPACPGSPLWPSPGCLKRAAGILLGVDRRHHAHQVIAVVPDALERLIGLSGQGEGGSAGAPRRRRGGGRGRCRSRRWPAVGSFDTTVPVAMPVAVLSSRGVSLSLSLSFGGHG